jgi:tetratricopeptide (TPR) repeat protein
MKLAVLVAACCVSLPFAAAAQTRQAVPVSKAAEAYAQFLLAHHLEEREDENGAIAAYKRAMELDPSAADIPAELAALYLRQSKVQEAMAAAEQALKVGPANREANRVLGIVYAALSEGGRASGARAAGGDKASTDNLAKAIRHLEAALERPIAQGDPNVRATLARVYVTAGQYEKAIPVLTDLVSQESGWQDGPAMLAEAFAGAGRNADAITWFEEHAADDPRLLPSLGDFYERERRWSDAVAVYERAQQRTGLSAEMKARYASALLNAGGRPNLTKARDVLTEVTASRASDALGQRALYLLSQAQRRLGDPAGAEASARKVIAQNSGSPWGYYALAEALEERRQYQAVVDALAPVVAKAPGASFDIGLLLPHLGFAYQELGQHDKAIATFEQARRLAPKDPSVVGYLVEANIAAKKYTTAVEVARAAAADHPDDLRLLRLEARALRYAGKPEQGISLLEEALKNHADEPTAYVALAQVYAEADRGAQAVKLLQEAQAKFPSDTAITFELGAAFDKQKRFAESEAAFRRLLSHDPENAAALNYLGYMLAERGERLDESVTFVKKALQLEPENGSFLDSLGWAYFKADKLDLAEDSLRRAAEQLHTNSVIQEHYGEVLLKLGRLDEAIVAFTRALAGDGDSIDRGDIDRKIRAAKQKLNKK